MRVIHKYYLDITKTRQTIELPAQCDILAAAIQDGKLVIWVELDPGQLSYFCDFEIYWTGQPYENNINRSYVATVQDNAGLVYHIFKILV